MSLRHYLSARNRLWHRYGIDTRLALAVLVMVIVIVALVTALLA